MANTRKRLPKVLTADELNALRAACPRRSATGLRNRAMVEAMAGAGLRVSEVVALRPKDIDWTKGTIRVNQGKGNKDRITFLGAQARKALAAYLMERTDLEPQAPVWLSERGAALTTWGLGQLLQRLGERAEVEHCHPHTFRRTCALWSLRAGMSIYHLQNMLGHSDLAVLRRYLAIVEGDVEEAHRKHGPVDNLL